MALALRVHQRRLQMVIIEPNSGRRRAGPHGFGYRPLSHLPHALLPVASDYSDIVDAVGLLIKELDRRSKLSVAEPQIIVVLDNFDRLISQSGSVLRQRLFRLIQEGQQAGIRAIVGLRELEDLNYLPILRLNFPIRLVGQVKNRGQFRQLGNPNQYQLKCLAEESFFMNTGEFIALPHGHAQPFKAAYLDDIDTYIVVESLRQTKSGKILARPRANAFSPRPDVGIKVIDQGIEPAEGEASVSDQVDWEDSKGELLEIASMDFEDFTQ
jgi:hypothetical protein